MVMRFAVLDEFGAPLRRFHGKPEAIAFMKNKRGCTLQEINLIDILGECLL